MEDKIYTDEELDEILDWQIERDKFLEGGKVPSFVSQMGRDYAKLVMGATFAFFGFFPLMWVWLFCNQYSTDVFRYYSFNEHSTEDINMLCVIVSILVVVLALIGLGSIIVSVSSTAEYTDVEEWMKKEIDKSDKICKASVQEATQPLHEEILDLQCELDKKDCEYGALKTKYKKLEDKLKDMSSTHNREKKLWSLEKKELQYQIKLKQGLVDEMDEADSPLGGLYN